MSLWWCSDTQAVEGHHHPPDHPAEAAEACWRSLVLSKVKRRFDEESPLAAVAATASAAAALTGSGL
ncbi:hypothetical protein VDGD_21069 [Verticillium dahliae]|nr:hypothetical protein VDGD_21069 [Verticillium dahliae]